MKKCIILIFSLFLLAACGKSVSVTMEDVKNIAYNAIIEDVENDNESICYLRTLYDDKSDKYWVEFYDVESYLSSLWLGFAIIDGDSCELLHTETNLTLYSGITPEMAVNFRKSESELNNEYGDFKLK